jgi:hypothetical protein
MKVKQLKLPINYSQLELFPDILLTYADYTSVMSEVSNVKEFGENYKDIWPLVYHLSMSLYDFINLKLEKPRKKEQLKAFLVLNHYQTLVLSRALSHFISTSSDSFKTAPARVALKTIKSKLSI